MVKNPCDLFHVQSTARATPEVPSVTSTRPHVSSM
jgi:hypothetical protein